MVVVDVRLEMAVISNEIDEIIAPFGDDQGALIVDPIPAGDDSKMLSSRQPG